MQMVRKFKSAKVQVTLVSDAHPKGTKHLFNNVANKATDEQIADFGTAIEMLTTEKYAGADIIITDQLTID